MQKIESITYKLTFLFLIVNVFITKASQIDTVNVFSKSMNKTIPNIVITPDTYSSQKKEFSVVYLLHGASGDYTNWVTLVPNIQEYADLYNIIIVCPDGNPNSWYLDSPIDKSMKYETYISKELVNTIDKEYTTKKDKSGRAITGLSMGGHGAFYLAFKHQDIWGAAGSMSGGLDLRPFTTKWRLIERLGDYATHKDLWDENSVTNMTHLLKESNLKLLFDCGVDDFFYDVNKKLHEKLLLENYPHDYTERPGKHNWDYWSNTIKYHLLFFNDFF